MAVVFSGTRKRRKRLLLKDEPAVHSPFCATEHAAFFKGGFRKGPEIKTLTLEWFCNVLHDQTVQNPIRKGYFKLLAMSKMCKNVIFDMAIIATVSHFKLLI